MTDLEMVRKCAEAMEIPSVMVGSQRGPGKEPFDTVWIARSEGHDHSIFNPLTGLFAGAYAMELVTHFKLGITPMWIATSGGRFVGWHVTSRNEYAEDINLNRAIVSCVAKMNGSGE